MFQQHDNWFDLLCILDLPNKKGTVQTAEERRAEEAAQKGKPYTPPVRSADDTSHESPDLKFIQSVLSGIEAKLGEEWVRAQFFDYTQIILSDAHEISRRSSSIGRFDSFEIPSSAISAPSTPTHTPEILSASSYPSAAAVTNTISRPTMSPLSRGASGLQTPLVVFSRNGVALQLPLTVIDKIKRRMEANRSRIRVLLSSSEYQSLPLSPWVWNEYESNQSQLLTDQNEEAGGGSNPFMTISGELLYSQIRRLQTESNLDEIEIEAIYSILVRGLTTESSLQALMTLLPSSDHGGLHILAVGLFHSNSRIRIYAVKLLTNFSKYPSTHSIYESMNQYYKHAIQRNLPLLDEGGGGVNGRNGSITR
jgi:hypothetical protein